MYSWCKGNHLREPRRDAELHRGQSKRERDRQADDEQNQAPVKDGVRHAPHPTLEFVRAEFATHTRMRLVTGVGLFGFVSRDRCHLPLSWSVWHAGCFD